MASGRAKSIATFAEQGSTDLEVVPTRGALVVAGVLGLDDKGQLDTKHTALQHSQAHVSGYRWAGHTSTAHESAAAVDSRKRATGHSREGTPVRHSWGEVMLTVGSRPGP